MSTEPLHPSTALAKYNIGTIQHLTEAGGTAGKTWKVTSETGTFFLRLRGVRTSSEPRLLFDHGLREHLVAHNVPTAAAIRTTSGNRWLRLSNRIFELYPFVPGRAFNPHSTSEIAEAATALAAYHLAAATYKPPSSKPEPIAQYTTLGFFNDVSNRMDDPQLQIKNMRETRKLASTDDERATVDRCIARTESMQNTYAGNIFNRLSGWVIHGDYTPANLLFTSAGKVAGIFDLDWALPGARVRDVADGLYFFATVPRTVDPASIWSLTDAADFDLDRCAIFLNAYHKAASLSPDEITAIPSAFTGRWLSIHLEGMAKVTPEDRFRFFSRDIEKPLHWLDNHWPVLKNRVFQI
ncbi:MAG: phosphotransferase [bacterium]|nr:phosphotransferase [bacterium]